MSGLKKAYNTESKEYFDLFGLEEKYAISIRSLTSHYKRVSSAMKKDNSFLENDRMNFIKRAFDTLSNPIERAKYIVSLHGVDVDIHDSKMPEDIVYVNQLTNDLHHTYTVEDVTLFTEHLRHESDSIIQSLGHYIDVEPDYDEAASLISRWYAIQSVYSSAKDRKKDLEKNIINIY